MPKGRNVNPERAAVIDSLIEEVQKIEDALREVKETGHSTAKTLKRLGLNPVTFRRLVYDTTWVECSYQERLLDQWRKKNGADGIPTLSWQEMLFCDCFGLKPVDGIGRMPEDVDETMLILVGHLSEREQHIIRDIYENALPYSEVSRIYSVTEGRIREIVKRAIRKLTWRGRKIYMVVGEDEYVNRRVAAARALDDEVVREREEYLKTLDRKIDAKLGVVGNPGDEEGIETLDLTVRAYNCLWRAGIRTIGDLKNLSVARLMKVRNLGAKCVDEIRRVMRERFDFEFKTEEE